MCLAKHKENYNGSLPECHVFFCDLVKVNYIIGQIIDRQIQKNARI